MLAQIHQTQAPFQALCYLLVNDVLLLEQRVRSHRQVHVTPYARHVTSCRGSGGSVAVRGRGQLLLMHLHLLSDRATPRVV